METPGDQILQAAGHDEEHIHQPSADEEDQRTALVAPRTDDAGNILSAVNKENITHRRHRPTKKEAKIAKYKEAKVLMQMTQGTLAHMKKLYGGAVADQSGYICQPPEMAKIQNPGRRDRHYDSEVEVRPVLKPRNQSPNASEPGRVTPSLEQNMRRVTSMRHLPVATPRLLPRLPTHDNLENIQPVGSSSFITQNDQHEQQRSGNETDEHENGDALFRPRRPSREENNGVHQPGRHQVQIHNPEINSHSPSIAEPPGRLRNGLLKDVNDSIKQTKSLREMVELLEEEKRQMKYTMQAMADRENAQNRGLSTNENHGPANALKVIVTELKKKTGGTGKNKPPKFIKDGNARLFVDLFKTYVQLEEMDDTRAALAFKSAISDDVALWEFCD